MATSNEGHRWQAWTWSSLHPRHLGVWDVQRDRCPGVEETGDQLMPSLLGLAQKPTPMHHAMPGRGDPPPDSLPEAARRRPGRGLWSPAAWRSSATRGRPGCLELLGPEPSEQDPVFGGGGRAEALKQDPFQGGLAASIWHLHGPGHVGVHHSKGH